MPLYSKRIKRRKKWKAAFESYESICGFEPMYQDDVDEGKMTIKECWESNTNWLENVLADVTNIPVPWDDK